MITMAEHRKNGTTREPEFNLDFGAMFPDWDGFPVWWLAKRWKLSDEHWINLIDSGELKLCVDLRTPGSSRSALRITRASLLEFLHRRKDLAAVAAANPRPKYREESKRRPKLKTDS
jgi:hypothetical protein